MKPPKTCPYALSHLNAQLTDNRVCACYRSIEKLGDQSKQSLSAIMNSPQARQHRKTLMGGDWPEGCHSCKDFESRGLRSTRLHGIPNLDLDRALAEYDPATGTIQRLRSIEIRLSNLCNLACRHCSTVYSSRWEKMVKDDPGLLARLHRNPEVGGSPVHPDFIPDLLENIVPSLELMMFSGGEVLIQKDHYQIISQIKEEHAKNIELLYVTNGTVRGIPGWDLQQLWKKFKYVTVIVSTDGVGDLFDYFRQGADWNQVEENIHYFGEIADAVNCEVTCSTYQLFYLPETLDHLYETFPKFGLSSALVQHPFVINPTTIPQTVKLQLKEEWDTYLAEITDPVKKAKIKAAGQYPIDYMMGEEASVFRATGHSDDWRTFAEHVHEMDRLFKTDINHSLPKIAETLPRI